MCMISGATSLFLRRKRRLMNKFLTNIWTKRGISAFCSLYCLLVIYFGVMSFSYDFYIPDKGMFITLYIGISLFFTALMLFTRHQVLTRLFSFIMLIAFLPTFLFNFGNWALIIPMAVSILVLFFFSGAGEGVKTILGTIILLVYILSTVAFFMYSSVVDSSGSTTFIEEQVSPSGLYRYRSYMLTSTLKGGAKIYVEPNTLDKDLKFIKFIAKNYDKVAYYNTSGTNCVAEWDENDNLYVRSDPDDQGPWFEPERDSIFLKRFIVIELYGYDAIADKRLTMEEVEERNTASMPAVTEPEFTTATTPAQTQAEPAETTAAKKAG